MDRILTPPSGRAQGPRYGSVLDHLREGFQVIGFDFRYLYVNEAVCEHAQKSRVELLGNTMTEVFPGIEQTPMFARLSGSLTTRVPDDMENEFPYPDGTTRWFELRFEPVPEGVLVLSVDITLRKQLELQLMHAQKMEALGQLASGVAHDFNNILTVISSYGNFVAERLEHDPVALADMSEVLSASKRAESLVAQLLAFSRKQAAIARVVDVNEIVKGLDAMLRSLLGDHIAVETRLRTPLPAVRIDPGGLEQVLVNLAVNARDAMPDGGTLMFRTELATLDRSAAFRGMERVEPGEYVVIEVSDDGAGMDTVTQQRVFEPFFTTKPVGRGTGLGLSMCDGIVRNAGGHVWLYSEVGFGTTFKIYLPRVDADPVAEISAEPTTARSVGDVVLVVDDDQAIRVLIERVLQLDGYQVITMESPQKALEYVRSNPGELDLLITDMNMPEMTGRELLVQVRQSEPDLRVLIVSGYIPRAAGATRALDGDAPILAKPFSPKEITAAVRRALER